MQPPSRPLYAALALAVIVLGLASRRYAAALPEFVADYAGDTLWATMVFFLLALAFPKNRTALLALAALAIAFAVEFSQLYHAPWLDAIRSTHLGALALGNGFLWSDLICYVIGVSIGAAADWVRHRKMADRASDI